MYPLLVLVVAVVCLPEQCVSRGFIYCREVRLMHVNIML